MSNPDRRNGITVTFDSPIPMLGLHAQHLGVVKRCRITPQANRVDALELQTSWQNIEIERSAVSYDVDKGVFRLIRGDALVHRVD